MMVTDEDVGTARGILRLEIRRAVLAELRRLYRYGWAQMSASEIEGHVDYIDGLARDYSRRFYRDICSRESGDRMSVLEEALEAVGVPLHRVRLNGLVCCVRPVGIRRPFVLARLEEAGRWAVIRSKQAREQLRIGEWCPIALVAGSEYRRQFLKEVAHGRDCSFFC